MIPRLAAPHLVDEVVGHRGLSRDRLMVGRVRADRVVAQSSLRWKKTRPSSVLTSARPPRRRKGLADRIPRPVRMGRAREAGVKS